MKSTTELLEALWRNNEAGASTSRLKQEAGKPRVIGAGVPTLSPRAYMPMTPMLNARFEFASLWVNAAFGHTWLGIAEMESAWTDGPVQQHLEVRKKYYNGHLLQKVEWNRITLFGIDLTQGEETLLLWDGSTEPSVFCYVGYEQSVYADLNGFLEALGHLR